MNQYITGECVDNFMESTILRPKHNEHPDFDGYKIKLEFPYPTFTLFFKHLLKNKSIDLIIDTSEHDGFDNVWYVDFWLPQDTPDLDENQERYYTLKLNVREYSGDFENRSLGTILYYPDRAGHTFKDHFEGKLDDTMGDGFDLNMSAIGWNIFQSYDGTPDPDPNDDQKEIWIKRMFSDRTFITELCNHEKQNNNPNLITHTQ